MSSTEAAVAIEFRCNRCWQVNYAPVEAACKSVTCASCNADVPVPEATPERLKELDSLPEVRPQAASNIDDSRRMSDVELMRVVHEDNNVTPGEMNFSGYAEASSITRLCAVVIDCFATGLAFGLGVIAMIAADNAGLIEFAEQPTQWTDFLPMGVMYFFPIVLFIVQWNMIATRGQTIGKFVTCIRIVSIDGSLPGFFWGVIMRNWVRNLLMFIPFFGLIDVLFIFTSSRRCIHDYLAATRVVQS